MNGDRPTTVPAKASATIVMLREGPEAPELLMVRRRAGDVFGGNYAFPGGLVDDNEPTAHEFCQGITAGEADKLLHVSAGGLNFYSAAIRESFEETGILLAQDAEGNWPPDSPALQELRVQVDKGILRWSEFLRDQGLHMVCNALHYFAHWETPLIEPKRWSARFFFAEMPSDQDVQHDGGELTDSLWITAADALSASRDGTMKLPFPTIRSLRMFSEIDSIDGLLAWADERALAGVQKTRPARFEKDGNSKWTIPGDPEYPGE
jgi:8-oxo-dGTP pyrophosphatase MutT (NUDIX family)